MSTSPVCGSSAGFARATNSGLARRVACLLGRAEPAELELLGGGFGRGASPPPSAVKCSEFGDAIVKNMENR